MKTINSYVRYILSREEFEKLVTEHPDEVKDLVAISISDPGDKVNKS